MTTKDLGQKVVMRRVFWAMGASTRLEVKLGALQRTERSRSDREEWTDIDVLAVHYSALTGLSLSIADCKTSRGRVAERLFWLRGVMDVVGADQGFLVREEPLSGAARQLAFRLGITAMAPEDRAVLLAETGAEDSGRPAAHLSPESGARRDQLYQSVPKSLERLMRYRETGYWLAPGHRNMTALLSVLVSAREGMAPTQPWTLSLVADLAWLYLLACIRALVEVATLHLSEPMDGLAQVVVGDERERRDKEFIAAQLKRVFQALPKRFGPPPPVDVFPAYYADLGDLMVRLLRRRSSAIGALRALEVATAQAATPKASGLDANVVADAYAWKLASDVVRFLVRAGSLDRSLQDRFDALVAPTTHAGETPLEAGSEARTGAAEALAASEAEASTAESPTAASDASPGADGPEATADADGAGPPGEGARDQIRLFADNTAPDAAKEAQ